MDILDALDEINQRHKRVDTVGILKKLNHNEEDRITEKAALNDQGLTAEDEELIRSMKFHKQTADNEEGLLYSRSSNEDNSIVKQIKVEILEKQLNQTTSSSQPAIIVKKKRKLAEDEARRRR